MRTEKADFALNIAIAEKMGYTFTELPVDDEAVEDSILVTMPPGKTWSIVPHIENTEATFSWWNRCFESDLANRMGLYDWQEDADAALGLVQDNGYLVVEWSKKNIVGWVVVLSRKRGAMPESGAGFDEQFAKAVCKAWLSCS